MAFPLWWYSIHSCANAYHWMCSFNGYGSLHRAYGIFETYIKPIAYWTWSLSLNSSGMKPHQKQTRSCFSIWSCKTVCVTHGATLLVGCRSWVFSLGWNMSRELSPLSPSPTLRLSPPPCCLAFLPVSPAPRLPGSQAPCHLVLLVGSEARSWDQHCLPSSYVGSEARSWDQHCLPSSYVGSEARSWDQHCLPSSYVGSEARSWDQHCLPSSYTLAISGCREWMKWSSLLQQLPALFI